MPSHRVHRASDKVMGFGDNYEWVHRIKDEPARFIPGTRHRQLRHDPKTNVILALVSGDPVAFLVGQNHDLLDAAISKLPKQARQLIEAAVG